MSQQETVPLQERKQRQDLSASLRLAAANSIRDLVGKPWIHQGRNPALGLDCVGLAIMVAKAAGIDPDVPWNYSRIEPKDELLSYVEQHCRQLKDNEDMEPGDLLVMSWPSVPSHLGIYVGAEYIIHSYMRHGITLQQLIPFWAQRVTHVYRLIEAN